MCPTRLFLRSYDLRLSFVGVPEAMASLGCLYPDPWSERGASHATTDGVIPMISLNSINKDPDRLYKLLPTVYRQRDADQEFPLQALLRVITEQVIVVEQDIAQLYDNWFIETCQDWVVPYIADLIGYQVVHEAGEPDNATTPEGQLRNKILIPRRDVANTIRDRRRKGTLALLEQLASDVAGWPARAVEFFTLLGWYQNINALHLERGRTVDVRNGDALDRLDGP